MLFDPAVVEAVIEATPEPVAVALLVCSFAGSAVVIGPAVAAAYLLGDRQTTATWIGIVAGFYAVMAAAKPFFAAPRPMVAPPFSEAALPAVLEPLYASAEPATRDAFPSGHTIAATAFWGLVAADSEIGRRRHRLAAAAAIAAVVGLSRIVLGVHYPGDVLGGALVGAAYLAAALWVRRAVGGDVPTVLALGLGAAALALLGPWAGRMAALVGVIAGGLLGWTLLVTLGAAPEPAPWWSSRRAAVVGAALGLVIGVGLATPGAVVGSRWRVPVFALAGCLLVVAPAATRRVRGRPVRTEGQKQ